LAVGNTFDSLIGMVSAGRGVHLSPEIAFLRHRTPAINFHVLRESTHQFELYAVGIKDSEPTATVNNFVRILLETIRCLPVNYGETHDK
jgi:hypothetical protein